MASGPAGSSDGEPTPGATPAAAPSQPLPGHLSPGHQAQDGDAPPATRRDAGAWLMFAGLGFVVGQLASSILLVVVAGLTGHGSEIAHLATQTVPPAWVEVTGLVGLWVGFVGAVLFASRVRGTGSLFRDMGLRVRPWDVLIGPVIGLGGQLVLLPVLYFPLEHVVPHLDERLKAPAQHLTGGFPGSDLAVIAVLTVVVVPVVEEMFFRGLVLRALLRVFKGAGPVVGVALAAIADGVIFGLAHFELLELLGLATFGAVLALMAYKFGRLGPGIFAHGTFNLLAILSVAGILH
ncbi:MAG TPA: type II CAAX endopeptidase family protein [Acidimicrobiales bacterium]